MSRSSRFGELDGLRALAIVLVILDHSDHHLIDPPAWLHIPITTGWNGVFLFFVLSGFLVGNLAFKELDETRKIHVPRFWLRRFFRTWPLYFSLVAFGLWRIHRDISPPLINYLTFTQNFFQADFFGQTWSLAVEEQFYFTLPIIVAILGAKRSSWLPYLMGAGIAIAMLFRFFAIPGDPPPQSLHTLFVFDSLIVGIGIAYLYRRKSPILEFLQRWPNVTFFAGLEIVYLPMALSDGALSRVLVRSGLAFGFGLMLIAGLKGGLVVSPILRSRVAYVVALVSYSMYLSHDRVLFVAMWMTDWLHVTGLLRSGVLIGLGLIGCTAVGCVLYFTIEKPFLMIRDRLLAPRPSQPAVAPHWPLPAPALASTSTEA